MKLSKMKANECSSTLKVTIQKTGKLGFTRFTAEQLGLDLDTYVSIFKDDDAIQSPVFVFNKEKSIEAFPVHVASGYYSLSTTALFDKLGFDFKSNNIICDLKREPSADEYVGGEAYRLIVRQEKKKKSHPTESQDEAV